MNRHKLNLTGGCILDAAITVNRELGPGLLESAYETALITELRSRNIRVEKQVPVELIYKDVPLGKTYFIDLLVESQIIIEVKSVDTLNPIHDAQLITYLKLSNKNLGYLINFNVPLLKEGFKRIVWNFQ